MTLPLMLLVSALLLLASHAHTAGWAGAAGTVLVMVVLILFFDRRPL